jgi:hypothetical protein
MTASIVCVELTPPHTPPRAINALGECALTALRWCVDATQTINALAGRP